MGKPFLAEHVVLSWRCLLELQQQRCGGWGLSGFSRKAGGSQAAYTAALFCWCVAWQGEARGLPSTLPMLGKENWASPSIRASKHFLLAPPPRVAVVLYFLCWQNYWKRGSG